MANTLRCSALCCLKVERRHRDEILPYLCFPSELLLSFFVHYHLAFLNQGWFLPVKQNEMEYSWHWNCGADYAVCSPCICRQLQEGFPCALSQLQGGTVGMRPLPWGVCKPQWEILQRIVFNILISSLQYLFSPDCMRSGNLGYGAKASCPF